MKFQTRPLHADDGPWPFRHPAGGQIPICTMWFLFILFFFFPALNLAIKAVHTCHFIGCSGQTANTAIGFVFLLQKNSLFFFFLEITKQIKTFCWKTGWKWKSFCPFVFAGNYQQEALSDGLPLETPSLTVSIRPESFSYCKYHNNAGSLCSGQMHALL